MQDKIKKKIKKGIKSTYLDIIRFNKETDADIKPEYLVTVNIAQRIAEINDEFNRDEYPLRIKLEEKARRFLNACKVYVPATTFKELFTLNYWKDIDSDIPVKSKQRVDIAVYNNEEIPIAIIEVKKFTVYPNSLKKDIKRNLNFLGWYNNTLFDSELKNSYLVFLFNDKESITENQIKAKIIELKKFYETFIHSLNITSNIDTSVDVYSITDSLLTSVDLTLPKDIQQYKYEERHHYLSIIIEFSR